MTSIKLFHGTVMAGKTKLLSDFLSLMFPSEYLLVVPNLKYQNGNPFIKSRSPGYEEFYPSLLADPTTDLYECVTKHKSGNTNLKAVFIEEIQFYTRAHVDQLFNLIKDTGIPVLCFGISRNHKNEEWDTIKYMESKGCTSQEICTKCNYCSEVARTNIRYDADFSAEPKDCVNDDGIEKYLPCCLVCWKKFYDRSMKKKGWFSFIKNLSICKYIFPKKMIKVGMQIINEEGIKDKKELNNEEDLKNGILKNKEELKVDTK